ncbi:hypothetical protein F5X68DRAFT_277000 [Plectosphaerella plurivora]|uniref:NAD(P)-binding domain-containing protein n=1 Tax=Plectosphaerella plurivora TaxID=936078 RepID=A0A9P9AAA4_9PEZI|nr:hypothetical protein F5X68DRAFT_277000 [Plectosphaerella plurivora]
MKLIVTGATGYVASEVLRLAVKMSEITSVVAVARRPVKLTGPGADKIRSVVIEDMANIPMPSGQNSRGHPHASENAADMDDDRTVAVLPQRTFSMDADEVRRVCETAVAGLSAMSDARPAKPFRFLHMSGTLGAREKVDKPLLMGTYGLMWGDVEKKVLALAAELGVEACVAKPGFISNGSGVGNALGWVIKKSGAAPALTVTELSRAMLRQVVGGFEKEPLTGEDLERLGRQ